MVYTIIIDVFCDCDVPGSTCPNWVHGCVGESKLEARRNAIRQGWKYKNGKFICPDCQETMKDK